MKKIFILSCWRSGTSWLEDMLGKKVEGSRLFGHEQQILTFLAMSKKCFYDNSLNIRRKANKPLCDIDKKDFYEEFGMKQHKILSNTYKWTKLDFRTFALKMVETFTLPYEARKYKQMVEKSPENGSPEVFNCAIEIFSNTKDFNLVYLVRDFRPYLASCHRKFVRKGKNSLGYYSKKWLQWNTNAINTLKDNKANNIFILSYEDLVKDPSLVEHFCEVWKTNTEVRANVLTKWETSPIIEDINKLYNQNLTGIKAVEDFVKKRKIIHINKKKGGI